ncbi:MAG: metal ABC transporter ATP-binding protein [Akkermansia sp.]
MVSDSHICWGGGHPHPHRHELCVCGLCAAYGEQPALEELSFTARCGQTLALMGPNGAGKSTLLNVLAGLHRPTAGSVLWNGTPLHRQQHEIAYLPQSRDIDPRFPITVREVVAMGRWTALGTWGAVRAHDRAIIDKALSTLDLEELAERQIGALSGGQQQRVFLARALAQEAHILLLDEPFTGLDVPGTAALARILRELACEGRLIIASHHELSSAPGIFDEALLLRRRLIAAGRTAEVLSPTHLQQAFPHRFPS